MIRDRLHENPFKQIEAHVMLGSKTLLNVLDIEQKQGHESSFEFYLFNMASFSKSTLDMTSGHRGGRIFG